MKSDIKVSVLLAVFNAEKYISEAVDSVLNQTFRDFEFIIINDGSTDRTLDILKVYESRDDRIRLISRENKGLITSLNEGIDLANGEWIARMDADDISLPNRLEKQLQWVEKSGTDITGCWVKFFGSLDQRVWRGCVSDDAIKVDMLFKCPLVHPSVMMRSTLLKQLKYDHAAVKVEDYDLWVRAAQQGAIFANVPEVLLHYRRHPAQVTVVDRVRQLESTEDIRRNYWDSLAQSMHKNNTELSRKSFDTSVLSNKLTFPEQLADFCKGIGSQVNQEAKKVLMDNLYKLSLYKPSLASLWMWLGNYFGLHVSFYKKYTISLAKLLPSTFRTKVYVRLMIFLQSKIFISQF